MTVYRVLPGDFYNKQSKWDPQQPADWKNSSKEEIIFKAFEVGYHDVLEVSRKRYKNPEKNYDQPDLGFIDLHNNTGFILIFNSPG